MQKQMNTTKEALKEAAKELFSGIGTVRYMFHSLYAKTISITFTHHGVTGAINAENHS